jgi:surfeit locus 1 family protein
MKYELPLYAPKQPTGIWPLLAVVAGIAIAVALGFWQLGRAAEKRDVQSRLEALGARPPIIVSGAQLRAEDVELRRVEARGTFEPRGTVFIDNRLHRGIPGYHVVTPLKLDGADRYVLVNRGWIARTLDRAELPKVETTGEVLTIQGIAVIPRKRTLELSEHVMEGPIWQNLTIDRYREARPLPIQPFMIQQESPAGDGLAREWPAPDLGIEKHYGYAFQWFALAATLLVFYAATRYRRKRSPGS